VSLWRREGQAVPMQALLRLASQGETCARACACTRTIETQSFKEEIRQEVVIGGHLFSLS